MPENQSKALYQKPHGEPRPWFVPFPLEELDGIPHLHPLAQQSRPALKAYYNLRDKKFLNMLEFVRFVARFNTDFVFRLTVTREYALLLELFKDPLQKARWAKFLDDISRSERREHQRREYLYEAEAQARTKPKPQAAIPLSSAQPNEPPFSWVHPDPSLSHAEKLQHYEAELDRISFVYYSNRAQIHLEAIDSDLHFISELIEALSPDVEADLMARGELDGAKLALIERRRELLNRALYKADGALDIAAAMKKDGELVALQNSTSVLFQQISKNRPQLETKITDYEQSKAPFISRINLLDADFKEQREQLTRHINHSLHAYKQEISEGFTDLCQSISKCSVGEEGEIQSNTYNLLLDIVRRGQERVQSADSSDSIRNFLADCINDLNELRLEIPEVFQELELELKQFFGCVINEQSTGSIPRENSDESMISLALTQQDRFFHRPKNQSHDELASSEMRRALTVMKKDEANSLSPEAGDCIGQNKPMA